jgi:hypothetical protein
MERFPLFYAPIGESRQFRDAPRNVRFGSLAALQSNISLMFALGREAAIRESSFEIEFLNVCFHL